MANIPAPGVAQARLKGKIGPNPWAVVLHWFTGGATTWTQAQINALATAVSSNFTSNILPTMANNVHYETTLAVDLSDATARFSETPAGSLPGGGTAESPTLASCILVQHRISAKYRGGHPRTYLPPPSKGQVTDGDNWQPGFVPTFQASWDAFITGVNSNLATAGLAQATLCCPRYAYSYTADNVKHKFVKTRVSFKGAFPVSASVVDASIATQRRRLGN